MRTLLAFILAFFSFAAYTQTQSDKTQTTYTLETVAQGLNFPWSIAFLPNGDYLLAMRSAELRRISPDGVVGEPLNNLPESYVASQGGYFDVVLDPNFTQNKTLYLAFAYGTEKANGVRVVKASLAPNSLEQLEPIFTIESLKDTPVHYGGRLQFINDGTLLITTGDGFNYREAAQDKSSQLGKIIRINKDGSVPNNNPFANNKNANAYIYSLGHRNPQGLAYDSANNIIYMHEHGPLGGDEVNIIEPGHNYGWPATSYGVNYSGAQITPLTQAPGITDPIHYWAPSIAPSGLAYYNGSTFPAWQGSLFVGALVDKEVRRLTLNDGEVIAEESLFKEIGERIREIKVGPDGFLYILTDSDNGKLIRVRPQ